MKQNELFQNIDTLMTEVLDLKKSWDEKMEKAEDEPSDAQDDAVHMADHGADEESLAEYAKKLSDEELHELISSLVQEAEGRGGEGEETEAPEVEESQEEDESEEPEMEKADEQMPEDSEAVEMPEQDADAESAEPEEAGDLGSKVAELSDEEIQTLMSAIQAEMGSRGGGAGPAPVGKSEHEEKMEKSLRAAIKKIDELSSQIDSLKKSNAKKVDRKESMPSQKYADPKVTVLEKSVPEDSKVVMTGATLANWLISEQAAGNKKVNSDIVTKANLAKSVEDASEFYKELERIGIKAPRS